MIDVIIVNYNTAHLLARMFAACDAAGEGLALRYWVVDNASRDDSVAVLQRDHPGAFVQVNAENVGFGRANNQMVPHLLGDYVLLLNTDAFVQPDSLRAALDVMQRHPRCGVVGVRLTGEDGSLQPSCRYFPTPFNVFLNRTGLARLMPWVRLVDELDWDHQGERECDWVPGCFFLMRKSVVDEVGLFDPRYFLYSEEVDLCRRVKAAGWSVFYTGATSVVHLGGESAKSASTITQSGRQISALQVESELLYYRKHYGLAGVLAHVVLAHLGDFVLSMKNFIKYRRFDFINIHSKNGKLISKILKITKYGMYPTK
ncbi:glycosyltransferase family 2 protein [Comamonas badia]|uniref:glycosyltransferase family 2 protein n=1 Tax=Comamonas badia TaxID=265291 RepID=UPI000415283A|nr:glycosyltransferase family 2 protein [Comamonas badia]